MKAVPRPALKLRKITEIAGCASRFLSGFIFHIISHMIRVLKRYFIRRRPFPEEWQNLLNSSVPYYRFLPNQRKQELKRHMPVILEEKIFEGCGGLVMTEEKRVVIAAYATILILGEPAGYYPDLKAILLYPDDYVAPVHQEDEHGFMTEGHESRSGESWDLGSIVLSWKDIQRDIHEPFNGRNLIFHEFAHQLDDRYGMSAGIGEDGRVYKPSEWNNLLASEYRDLIRQAELGRPSIFDPYGASHPAEFFSVATETFFEDSHRMKREKPKLYELFRQFYKLDPASWLPWKG